ncbi:hypothetical protein VC83_00857 [Pseudogymnoascus destructans]|uniref:Uncharacterized protein n=2 Tax=Pseudogymnoascus destructans TaxID=655981 RepID=L8FL46_PSED2|nr:uncharacterized protein VC83_00857 [Pseudogymnoascus destructans]ELR01637.1 hypothetical protein GMDG_00013 [Pseudogymnoascus destructans 20631-21]OAF62749.1 hypothetical protein VC83_00857 [Pseudogymnoascus destructans]
MATSNSPDLPEEELDEDLLDDILSRAQECEKSRRIPLDYKMNLAYNYRAQAKFPQAESVARDVVERRRRVLGDHADTASAMNSLSISIKAQERVEEGLYLDEKTLKMLQRVQGDEEDATHDEAAELHQKVVDFRVQKLGKNNRESIIAMDMLARDFTALGEWDKAQQLQSNFGDGDSTTITCILNLLKTYRHLGEPDKALKMIEDLLASFRQLGRDHTEPSSSLMKQLAFAYSDQDRFEEAEPLFGEFYEWIKGVLGPDHEVMEEARLDLRDNLVAQGKLVWTSSYRAIE